jgi:hypothetical protein
MIAAPILWDPLVPNRGVTTQVLNIHELPDGVREHMKKIVPLNQPVDELEALVCRYEELNAPVKLGCSTATPS